MPRALGIRVEGLSLRFLPYPFREVLRFGRESLEGCECARARVLVEGADGELTEGWGEVPLGATWAWPSGLDVADRLDALRGFCVNLAEAWSSFDLAGHALVIGHAFLRDVLPARWAALNAERRRLGAEEMPWLAALLCAAPFDLAIHDAYGKAMGRPSFSTYGPPYLDHDLAWFYGEAPSSSFAGRYPRDFLVAPPDELEVWHLVGGADDLDSPESPDPSSFPANSYPTTLRGWIRRDGISALKVKLRGLDSARDAERLAAVGRMCLEEGVRRIGIDFNGTVGDPLYVLELLEKVRKDEPECARRLVYVEQPFSASGALGLDVRALGSRLPLLMDESAVGWESVARGQTLGWTGVALKTCKTLTGALLSLCRAREAGMAIMVQDLTNPMLALVPHALLGAHAPSLGGIEANAAQYCPEASLPEAGVHPGLFGRRSGRLSVASIRGDGLGYGEAIRARALPKPVFEEGAA